MPNESVAQRERVFHAVLGHGHAVDHLWLDLQSFVGAKQGVVDKVAEVMGDVAGGPSSLRNVVGFRGRMRTTGGCNISQDGQLT